MKKLFHKEEAENAVTASEETISEEKVSAEQTSTEQIFTEESGEKKQIPWKKVGIIGGCVLGALVVVYLGFGIYFQSHFFFHSTINGVGTSGASVASAHTKLEKSAEGYELTLLEAEDKTEQLSAKDLGLEIDINQEEIQSLLKEQNGFQWGYYLFAGKNYMDDKLINCDTDTLQKTVSKLDCVTNANAIPTQDANLSYKDGEFQIVEEVYGTEIPIEDFLAQVEEAALQLQPELDLVEAKCYKQPNYTTDSKELKSLQKTLNSYVGTKITYQLGSTTEEISKDTIGSWLSGDENMEPAFDEEAMSEYISTMGKKYNTFGQSKQLATQYGVTVTVPGGNYGWKIDNEGEVAQLKEDIAGGKDVTRDFVYQYYAASHDGNDYGNSYVEINRTAQHLYLVIDGAVVLETNVVTGNPNNGHETPNGAFGITYCERNATLRGDNYATPVSYWMPFNGDIGLHDATWQSSFGGTRYKDGYGSHGCVNLPLSAAATIFSYVKAGFPVLMYDLPGTETLDTATQQAVDNCKNAINAIGIVSTNSGDLINAARSQYDALSDSGKAYVDNYQVLVDAETAYAQAWQGLIAIANQNAANDVIAKINAIGSPITANSKVAIEAAESAYAALSSDAKSLVTNYGVLQQARQALNNL
jgi:lipoprotein-anchoring transpeptidase ErfK/SrfK